ncbi:MAG: TAXI family TRAP transporter solute-binding subunit [Hyphomicrobiales bacterium]|nr:TAXI family TRAP transporter solute-binding subunit [Hyphomicrobiales bacterium]
MNRKFAALTALATIGALAAGPAAAQKLSMKRITIGSNPAGSTYFLLAGGFAKMFQQTLKVRATAQPHAGSSVYLPLMDKGEITMGLNSSLDSGMAAHGTAPYKNKMGNVYTLGRVWRLPYAYVVKASSGIKTMEDLKGKRAVVAFKTNVSLARADIALLASAGMTEKDVESVTAGGVVAGLNMVSEGRSDSAPVAVSMPQMRKAHATVPGGMFVLPIGEKGTDELLGKMMPGLYTMKLKPSKSLPQVDKEKTIAAFDTYLNITGKVSPEDGYIFAKTLYGNWKKLQKDYAPLRGVAQNELIPANVVLPVHPGAKKFYKEVKLWTPAHDAAQAKLK